MDLLSTVQGQLVGILALAWRWLDVVVWAESLSDNWHRRYNLRLYKGYERCVVDRDAAERRVDTLVQT